MSARGYGWSRIVDAVECGYGATIRSKNWRIMVTRLLKADVGHGSLMVDLTAPCILISITRHSLVAITAAGAMMKIH